MKILHTADVQLGAQFKYLGPKARIQREQLKETFHKVLELSANLNAAVVLIAGDLFDSNYPSLEIIEFVKGEFGFARDKNIQICIVPGHHDALTYDGIYNRQRFDDEFENIFIFRKLAGEVKEYPEHNLAVFGKPNISATSTRSPFPDLSTLKSAMPRKVLAAHGDLQVPGKSADNYHPISIREVEQTEGIEYFAFGHWHSMRDCSLYSDKFKAPVFYAGSPELVDKDQMGAGYVVTVDFSEVGAKASPTEVGKRKSVRLSLDVSSLASAGDIKKKIFESADTDTIVQLDLTGMNINNIFLDLESLESEVSNSVFDITINDKTHLSIEELPEYPDKLIQGQFIKLTREKINAAKNDEEKKIYETVLQMGLAELEGKEVV